jgi:hypothetical protein
VAFTAEDGVDLNVELDVAGEDVKRGRAEDDAVLLTGLLY